MIKQLFIAGVVSAMIGAISSFTWMRLVEEPIGSGLLGLIAGMVSAIIVTRSSS